MTCLANRVRVDICSVAFLPSRQTVKSLTSCFCLSILDCTGTEKLYLVSRIYFWTTSPTFQPPSYGSFRVIAALKPPKFSILQQSQLFVPSMQNFAPHALLFSIPHYKVLMAFSNDLSLAAKMNCSYGKFMDTAKLSFCKMDLYPLFRNLTMVESNLSLANLRPISSRLSFLY